MDNDDLLERDLIFTAIDAAYLVDILGLDNLLLAMSQYVRNPEQERAINVATAAMRQKLEQVHD